MSGSLPRDYGSLSALIAWLAFIAEQAVRRAIATAIVTVMGVTTLIAGLAFVAEQARRLGRGHAFFQFLYL